MSPRSAIFISAVSQELKSARQLVANTLKLLGHNPEWQESVSCDEGDLRPMLRSRIDSCAGVVQLVGFCYGPEPFTIEEQFGRVSYTQYEALYAASKGKKVWYLFLDEGFPTDPHAEEDEEKQKLQSDYRSRVKGDSPIYHPLRNPGGLEASALKLRDDLTRLRSGVKRWTALVAVLVVVSVGLTVWLLQSQQHSNQELQVLQVKLDKLQQGVNAFAEVQNQVRLEQPGQKRSESEERTYQVLSKQLGIDAKTLKEQLPSFAKELKESPNATAYERANAAFVAKDYNEAERLALAAADQANKASPRKNVEAVKAFELAGWADEKRIEYADALKHLRGAEKLTDRTRDGLEWARVQFSIAVVLDDQGQHRDAEGIVREVLKEREHNLGSEHPDTLATRYRLGVELDEQRKSAEAEMQFRELLKIEEKVFGPEHPDTLATRNSLAYTLVNQGKYSEAETEERALIRLKEKVLGPENPDTLRTRNNLGIVFEQEGKYAEAEAEDRAVIRIREKVLGPEHPLTLGTRNNLGLVLDEAGKYAEAEAEDRELIKIEERVLGPEHPDTLNTRNNLIFTLDDEGKSAAAETEAREVIKLREKVLGPEHPETIGTRDNLAEALVHQGKYAEAEKEYRAVIELREKVVGPEHPETLEARNNLADVFAQEGKYAEAEIEARAVIELRKSFRPRTSSDAGDAQQPGTRS